MIFTIYCNNAIVNAISFTTDPDKITKAYEKIAELIFSDVDKSTEYYEELYPVRELPEGARVTRFAPSPTGYLHFGGLYAGFASKLTADTTGGVFMLRIEDTDKKREIDDGVSAMLRPKK